MYQIPGDASRFYAAFTTGASDGLAGSAICTYSMEDIHEAFAGRFKEQVYLIEILVSDFVYIPTSSVPGHSQ